MARKPGYSNPAMADGMRSIAYSNAWGTHKDKRNKRARTRNASKCRSMKDWE